MLKVLEPIWTTKPETASRVRGRIEVILDWAKARGYRAGREPRPLARPSRQAPSEASRRSAEVEHHPALPYAEIGSFMVELRRIDTIRARALEFTILTAARSGEVLGATWNEIDLAEQAVDRPRQSE